MKQITREFVPPLFFVKKVRFILTLLLLLTFEQALPFSSLFYWQTSTVDWTLQGVFSKIQRLFKIVRTLVLTEVTSPP